MTITHGFARPGIHQNLQGFSYGWPSTNVHFLHGAIHFIQSKGTTFKIKRKRGEPENLSDIIQAVKNEDGHHNLMVIEGTSNEKLHVIEHNPYLFECYEKLQRTEDDLIIHGCSIVDGNYEINNDRHLWRAIMNAKISNIYIGIHNEATEIERIADALNNLSPKDRIKPNVSFYCS